MSAELIQPDLCYDYAYQQNNRYFTEENDGSKDPHITGSLFSDAPITVSLFVKNREDSDFIITNMTTSIDPIDTTQATYINPSTEVILPSELLRHSVTPQSSNDGHIRGVPIGILDGKEFFYLYYNLDPKTYDINMPLNAYLDYNATFILPNNTQIDLPPYHQQINSDIPLCVDGNFSYAPIAGTFNVEEAGSNYYNIYTQVARRVENFKVKAYDINNTDTSVNVSTVVAIELIDAGAFHETQTSCQEPDSALTPRVWVTFDNNISYTDFNKTTLQNAIDNQLVSDQILNQSNPIDEPEDFYSVIRRNSAFRISYNEDGNGSIIKIVPEPGGYTIANFTNILDYVTTNNSGNCLQDLDGDSSTNENISTYCHNAGTSSATVMTKQQLATCMECIYGFEENYICSRDNFAIRPEAFKISLSDDNTSTVNLDFANNTDKSGSTGFPFNLVAGYPYRIDINATSHTDESPVKGYVQSFDSDDERNSAFMAWTPKASATNCNEPEDRNMTFYLIDGTNTNPNPLNTWEDNHDTLINVGEYEFKVTDEEWTKYDWEENLTQHHNTGNFISNSIPDCIKSTPPNNTVPPVGNKVGCETSSVHIPETGTGTEYKVVNIRSHPYKIKVSGLSANARANGDTKNNTYVYMHTMDQTAYRDGIDRNMSYNIQGTFTAVDHNVTGGFVELTNFVKNCYAEDINMTLLYSYHPMTPADTLNLDYDLIDYNTSDSSVVYRPSVRPIGDERENAALSSLVNNIIPQGKGYFEKDMKGSITMDLGYNEPRTYNTPKNPIYASMNDFNITYKVQPPTLYVDGKSNHQIFGNVDIDQNVTFVYGRAKPNKFFYDDVTAGSILTPVSVVAYCDLGLVECQNRGLAVLATGMLTDAQSNESSWWYSQDHNTTLGNDGQVTLTASGGGTVNPVDATSINLTNGIDNTILVTNTGGTPNIVDIDFGPNTDRWLIYNKDANSTPSPFYRVRFIGSGTWSTTGNLPGVEKVVGDDVNKKKSNRVEW